MPPHQKKTKRAKLEQGGGGGGFPTNPLTGTPMTKENGVGCEILKWQKKKGKEKKKQSTG